MFQSLIVFIFHVFVQSLSNPTVPTPTPVVIMVPTTTIQPTSTPSATPILTVTPTQKPTLKPTITPTPKPTAIPHDISLFYAINSYRKNQHKPEISVHPLLCSIANERVEELSKKGSLDNHDGIKKHVDQLLMTFGSWHEVIHESSQPKSSDDVVLQGWASSDQHKESISNNQVDYGCGAQKSGFAVFILAKKK